MHIRRLDPRQFIQIYSIDVQPLYPWEGVVKTPFGSAWAMVKPGERCKPHRHHEQETFIIVRGQGQMTVGDESTPVGPGDAVYMTPFVEHILENTSEEEDLHFLAVWWEDQKALEPLAELAEQDRELQEAQVLLTPVVSGDLLLTADLWVRHARQRGAQGRWLAEGLGAGGGEEGVTTPRSNPMGKLAAALGIELASLPTTLEGDTRAALTRLFEKLREEGALEVREVGLPYCPACRHHLAPRKVQGACPRCGQSSDGEQCTGCGGLPGGVENLSELACGVCGGQVIERPGTSSWLALGRFAKAIEGHSRAARMPPRLRMLVDRWLQDGLPDVALSVPGEGTGITLVGFEGQILDPRLAVVAEVLARRAEGGEAKEGGPAGRRETLILLDPSHAFFHVAVMPVLLEAGGVNAGAGMTFAVNEDRRAAGGGARETESLLNLASEIPSDLLRFYLTDRDPLARPATVSREDLQARVEGELVQSWNPWFRELEERLARDHGGKAPGTGAWTLEHRDFYARLLQLLQEAEAAYGAEGLSPQRVVRAASELVRTARRFGASEEPWSESPARAEESSTARALELLAAKVLALVTAPLMPEFAAHLWQALGYQTAIEDAGRWEKIPVWVPGGQVISGLAAVAFPAVESGIEATLA